MTAGAAAAPAPAPVGLILCAHGARDARWAAPFERIAARLRAQRGDALQVSLAYLEFIAPAPPQAAAALAAAGCTRIAVLPLFLGAGGHVQRDLPRLVEAMRAAHPGVAFTLLGAIGENDAVLAAMADAALAALDGAAA